jgi:circadian clock protein KaiB
MSNKILKKSRSNVEAEVSVDEKYFFQLYITGILPNSARAIKNLKAICEQYLKGRYELEIIDIYQQPLLAVKEDIIVVPVLIKKFPLPEVRLIGDLSDIQSVLEGLDLL